MEKLLLFAGLLLALSTTVFAQDCATGYCPSSITVHHKAGMVSPITADITYGVVSSTLSGTQKCWITQNLGATSVATSSTDATTAARGWFWQWGLARGYQYNGSLLPATWSTPSSNVLIIWDLSLDPCRVLLGGTWRIPTRSEWSSVQASNTTVAAAYASVLKFHLGGWLSTVGGFNSTEGDYWASDALATLTGGCGFNLLSGGSAVNTTTWYKSYGFSLRCLRDF